MVRKVISCKKNKKSEFYRLAFETENWIEKIIWYFTFFSLPKMLHGFQIQYFGSYQLSKRWIFYVCIFFRFNYLVSADKKSILKKKNEIQILPQCNTLNENLCYFLVVEWFFTRFLWYTLHRHKQQFLQLIFLLHTYPFRFEHSLLLLIHVAATSNTQQTKNWKEKKKNFKPFYIHCLIHEMRWACWENITKYNNNTKWMKERKRKKAARKTMKLFSINTQQQ